MTDKPKADESFIDALWLIATNDGDAYRSGKDAQAAITNAFRQYQQSQREREREEFKLARRQMIKELAERWGEDGE